ncbi:ABC transporter substrate-binding protein [Candidatus Darwinibacter acetoxidans]|jgi:iron(III) transport system substrate-binding protein
MMGSKRRSKWVGIILLALLTASLLSVTALAKNEDVKGKVVIYTSMYEDIIEEIERTISKEFPNLDVVFFYGGTGTLQAKIAAELDAGMLGCDMLMVAEPSYSLELKEMGILHSYLTPARENLAFEYDPEGYWYPVRVCNMVLAYNPEKYSLDEIPTSFYDFAYDESVAGYISMSNPLTSGTALASISALRDKYGYEYYEALGRQQVMVESGSVALTKLETGECKVIMILEESVLKKREEDFSELEVIYPTDGTIIIPSTIMSIAEEHSANANIAAVEAITDWFLSPAGQEAIVNGWMHSVLKDFPKLPYDAIPTAEIQANHTPIDWEATYKEREEMRTKFEEAVKLGR